MESEKRIAVLEEQKRHAEERIEEYEKNSESYQHVAEDKIKKMKE